MAYYIVNRDDKKVQFEGEKTCKMAYNLALLGLSNPEIGIAFGVSAQTIQNWTNSFPEFRHSLEKGREIADAKVVRAMYKRACGYMYTEEHVTVQKDKNGESAPIVITTPVLKHQPSDVQAGIFWLTNRQRQYWSNTQKVDINARVQHNTTDLSDLTETELKALQKIGLNNLIESNQN